MKMNTANHLWLSALALVALVIGCGTNQPAAAADQNDDVIAIDILLQPDATMLKRAAAINEQLRKDFPKGFSLDASHRPHVSLVQRYVRTGDLDKVYAAVGKALDSAHVTSLKLEAFKYYYIADGALGLQGIVVKSTPELLKVQQAVVDAVTPFVVKNGTAAAFVPRPKVPLFRPWLNTLRCLCRIIPASITCRMSPLAWPVRNTSTRWLQSRLTPSRSRRSARPFTTSATMGRRRRSSTSSS